MKKSFKKYEKAGLPGGPNELKRFTQGFIVSQRGQWDYPGLPTAVPTPTGRITMKGVEDDLVGIDNLGNMQYMTPENEYQFEGDMVYEIPQAKKGGSKKYPKKYSRSLMARNVLFTKNPLFKKSKSVKNKIFDPNSPYFQDGGITYVPIENYDPNNPEHQLGYNSAFRTITYNPNSKIENINNPWWLGHELFHDKQNMEGRMSSSGIVGQRPNPYVASDESMGTYYDRRGIEFDQAFDKILQENPDMPEEEILNLAQERMYMDPSTIEGEAREEEQRIESILNNLKKLKYKKIGGEIVSFDFDDTLSTEPGLEMAQSMPNEKYIISARAEVTPDMIERARAAGISEDKIFATGSDKAKIAKIKELGINKHIDNKQSVVSKLGNIGQIFQEGGELLEASYGHSVGNLIRKQGGGITKLSPEEEKAFQKFYATLPENLQVDDPTYDIRGYWDSEGRPEEFNYDQPKESDGYYHAYSINQNTGEYLKSPAHETFQHAVDEDRKIGYRPTKAKNGKQTTGIDPAFQAKAQQVANNLGVSLEDLLGIMNHESGLNPGAVNPYTNATGLIQFMPNTARNMGTSVEALKNMSAIDQLDYVERFYKPIAGKAKDIGDLYMFTFLPAAIGKPDNFVIGASGSTNKVFGINQNALYKQNKTFDADKKGYYTIGDVKKRISNFSGRPLAGSSDQSIPGFESSMTRTPGEKTVVKTTIIKDMQNDDWKPGKEEEQVDPRIEQLKAFTKIIEPSLQNINTIYSAAMQQKRFGGNTRMFQDGGMLIDASDEDINNYTNNGYIVEEVDDLLNKPGYGAVGVSGSSPVPEYKQPSDVTWYGSPRQTVSAPEEVIYRSPVTGRIQSRQYDPNANQEQLADAATNIRYADVVQGRAESTTPTEEIKLSDKAIKSGDYLKSLKSVKPIKGIARPQGEFYTKEEYEKFDKDKLAKSGYYPVQLKDGNYELLKKEDIADMIIERGITPQQLSTNYKIGDSKSITKDFKPVYDYAQQLQSNRVGPMIDKLIYSGKSVDQAIKELVAKGEGNYEGIKQKYGEYANIIKKDADKIYAERIEVNKKKKQTEEQRLEDDILIQKYLNQDTKGLSESQRQMFLNLALSQKETIDRLNSEIDQAQRESAAGFGSGTRDATATQAYQSSNPYSEAAATRQRAEQEKANTAYAADVAKYVITNPKLTEEERRNILSDPNKFNEAAKAYNEFQNKELEKQFETDQILAGRYKPQYQSGVASMIYPEWLAMGPGGGAAGKAITSGLDFLGTTFAKSIPGLASIPGATIGNLLGAGFAADALVNRLPQIPGQLQRGEYAEAATNALTGALDVGTAGLISPLYKGVRSTASELGKFLGTEEGLLSNVYKLNPKALKESSFHFGNLKNILPSSNPEFIQRGLATEDAVNDLLNTGIVRNRYSAGLPSKGRWREKVYWGEEGDPMTYNQFIIIAKNKKGLSNRPVIADDIVDIQVRQSNGTYSSLPDWKNKINNPNVLTGYKPINTPEQLPSSGNVNQPVGNIFTNAFKKTIPNWALAQMRFNSLPELNNKEATEVLESFRARIKTPEGQKRLKELGITDTQILDDLKILADDETLGHYWLEKIGLNPNLPEMSRVTRHEIEHAVQGAREASLANQYYQDVNNLKYLFKPKQRKLALQEVRRTTTDIDESLKDLELRKTPEKVDWDAVKSFGEKKDPNLLFNYLSDKQRATNYFDSGSGGKEKSAFLSEVQQYMMNNNIIPKDSYVEVTPEMVKETFINAMFDEAGKGKYLRLFNIMKPTEANYKLVAENLNKMLSIAPYTILIFSIFSNI